MAAAITVDKEMVDSLRKAIKDCADRGLQHATKWAAELLAAVPPSKRRAYQDLSFVSSTPARTGPLGAPLPPASFPPPHPHAPLASAVDSRVPPEELALELDEEDILSAGTASFRCREFARAGAHPERVLECEGTVLIIASEKTALRDWNKLDMDRSQPGVPVNTSLLGLYEAASCENKRDPWILFLRGLLLYRLNRREEAIECALLSLQHYLWNWSAWDLLSNLINDGEELFSLLPLLPIPSIHPLVHLFQIRTLNTLHQPSENELENFSGSLWIMSLRANVLYHLHDFSAAEEQFEKILKIDPCRIDDIDVYSNILYVTENRLTLSRLAHDFLALDKDRPEVCCLVGNHYSLRAEHEKAIRYFRRATQLDRTYLSAWTLMGHEYVEMKNSHAAIEAYPRKDYRAWYGLGQAYELLNMHQYALHYYQHATALRPYDVRLWQAQGASYQEMGRLREAIECLKRALLGADANEIAIALKLARLHSDLDETADAVAYHQRVIEISRATLKPVAEWARSAMYVARYYYVLDGGDVELAKDLLEKVAGSNSEDADSAADLLKRVRAAISRKEGVEGADVDVKEEQDLSVEMPV
ncbi:TPR-like protein [Lactarius psammicola]|nr:TPR-like protein [Lactarius psammicola]